MTPKEKYEERKRLRMEARTKAQETLENERDAEERVTKEAFFSLIDSMRRIADAAELWADLQKES